MASVMAKCPENEAILAYLRQRQDELCGSWDGAVTRAFQKAIVSIAEQTLPVRSLHEASKCHHVGPSMQRQLKRFFASRPSMKINRATETRPSPGMMGPLPPPAPPSSHDVGSFPFSPFAPHAFPPASGPSQGHPAAPVGSVAPGSTRKLFFVPKKGSAAYAMLVSLLLAKLRGKEVVGKEELTAAAEHCGLKDAALTLRPKAPPQGRPRLERGAPRTYHCGWSSMDTLRKHNLLHTHGSPPKYCLTSDGHAVALECVKRGRIILPSREQLEQAAAAAAAAADNVPFDGDGAQPVRLGLQALDPTATPTSIVERSSFDTLRLPPLLPGEASFVAAFDVLLIISTRNAPPAQPDNHSTALAQQLRSQFGLLTEVRMLPVGDALWIARHKETKEEYVLDFVVELKAGIDFWVSMDSKHFKDQKLRLQRCGLRKLICLVQGPLDVANVAQRIRTTALQTELEDGFDVQRAESMADMRRRLAELTSAIRRRYSEAWVAFSAASATGAHAGLFGGQERCMTYEAEFLHVCRHIDHDTAGELFGHLLLKVDNVTADIAMAVLQKYPTLRSLAEAYQSQEGDSEAQARLLTNILVKNRPISEAISRKVHESVWS